MKKTMWQVMIAAVALALVASSVGSARAISPQPEPPVRQLHMRSLGPQPEPPDSFLWHRGINPQPEPPGYQYRPHRVYPQPDPRVRNIGTRFHRPGLARFHFRRGRR
jgi:hypothetical protein